MFGQTVCQLALSEVSAFWLKKATANGEIGCSQYLRSAEPRKKRTCLKALMVLAYLTRLKAARCLSKLWCEYGWGRLTLHERSSEHQLHWRAGGRGWDGAELGTDGDVKGRGFAEDVLDFGLELETNANDGAAVSLVARHVREREVGVGQVGAEDLQADLDWEILETSYCAVGMGSGLELEYVVEQVGSGRDKLLGNESCLFASALVCLCAE